MVNPLHSRRLSKQAGLPPGTPVHIGGDIPQETTYSSFVYNSRTIAEDPTAGPDAAIGARSPESITWLNINGVHDVAMLQDLCLKLGLHPLVIEDIANTEQRPKVEFYEGYIYVVLKMLSRPSKAGSAVAEQVSIVVFPDMVVTFQEQSGDVFELIRNRIRNSLGRIRQMGSDYLAYALIDAIVDSYYGILEQLEEELEPLEEQVFTDPSQSHARILLALKREIIFLRRTLWPLRDLLSQLQRDAHGRIDPDIQPFLRDLQDHVIQVVELLDSFEETVGSILDTYLSSVSNKMNDVMRVLTIIATIFIPLTFIVGVYGMNFDHMPELSWPWAYPTVWGIMIVLVVLLIIMFRRRKWL